MIFAGIVVAVAATLAVSLSTDGRGLDFGEREALQAASIATFRR